MKETVRSLRLYFGLVGILGAVLNALVLAAPDVSMLSKLIALFSLAVGAAALAVAVALPKLLGSGVMIINAVIVLLPVTSIIASGVTFLATGQLQWLNPVISVLIAGYLFANVKRLAAAAAAGPAPPV